MTELVTCSGCSREWDGYAQCPCGGYQEEQEDSQELDNIRKFRGPMKGSGGWWCSSSTSSTSSTSTSSTSSTLSNESWSFLFDKDEDVSFLSGEQIEKGLLLQIGSVNGLSKDIVIYIFNVMRKEQMKDIERIRKYHTNIIYRQTLLGSGRGTVSIQDDQIELHYFGNRIPDGRGLEWSIKWYGDHSAGCQISQGWLYLMKQIKIIGLKNYLLQEHGDIGGVAAAPWDIEATLERKILYLNTSPKDEVIDDYDNFIISERQSFLLVDCWGDSVWI